MDVSLDHARDTLIQGMSQISLFWGFPRGMGVIFGALYLSPTPLAIFYHQLLSDMQAFFHTLDHRVATLLTLDELRFSAIDNLMVKENVKID